MFEVATPIQNPAKCEVRSVIRFVNSNGERPAEIHKQIVAVYGNVMNRQNVTKWCCELSEGRTDVHDEVQEEVRTWFKKQTADFYDSGTQKLVPRLNKCSDNAGDVLKNKVMYRQFIHIVAFVNQKYCTCLRPLYLYFPETPRIYNFILYENIYSAFSFHFDEGCE